MIYYSFAPHPQTKKHMKGQLYWLRPLTKEMVGCEAPKIFQCL